MEKIPGWKRFFGVLLLNALLVSPVVYLVYKHYGVSLTPMDINGHLRLVEEGPEALPPPFRYRVLAPLVVEGMRVLPGYDTPTDFDALAANPQAKEDYFHFILLNFILTVIASGMLFAYLSSKVQPAFAWAGSLAYLFSFATVTTTLVPMSDAACHLAIMGAVLCLDRRRPLAFALVCLAGVFAKETVLVVLIPWIVASSLVDRRRLVYLFWIAPAVAGYLLFTRLMPATGPYAYYDPAFLLRNLFRVFEPSLYDRSFLFHIVLSHLPFVAALVGWAVLKARGIKVPVDPELGVFFFLLWFGVTMGIGNNAGRLASMAFPALVLFEARVLQAFWARHAFSGPFGSSAPSAPFATTAPAKAARGHGPAK